MCKDFGRHVVDQIDEHYKLGSLSPLLLDLREVMQDMISHKSHVSFTHRVTRSQRSHARYDFS